MVNTYRESTRQSWKNYVFKVVSVNMNALAGQMSPAVEKIDLSKLSVIVGEPDKHDAQEMERQLGVLGMRDVKIFRNMDRVAQAVHGEEADLLLCNMFGNESQARRIFSGVRNQQVGDNPFMVMMSMAGMMTEDDVRQPIDSGTDDLITLPFRRDNFVTRLNDLAWHRKKFVATATYVGPTRRSEYRDGEQGTEEFDVPNPVYTIGTGKPRAELRQQIQISSVQLNERKLNADVQAIRNLLQEIHPFYQLSQIDKDFMNKVDLMHDVIQSVQSRAKRMGYDNLLHLCDIAGNITADIKETPKPPNLRHLRAMPKLVEGLDLALSMGTEQLATA